MTVYQGMLIIRMKLISGTVHHINCYYYSYLNHIRSLFFSIVCINVLHWKWKEQQNTYKRTIFPFKYDKVTANTLCKDGPITCHLKDEEKLGLSDKWIHKNDFVNITPVFCENVGTLLVQALLYQIFVTEATIFFIKK